MKPPDFDEMTPKQVREWGKDMAGKIQRLENDAKISTALLNANSARLLEATAMVISLMDNQRPTQTKGNTSCK